MHKLLHVVKKEFLLLTRDKLGLLTLFLLPVLLLIVMSLIQKNIDQAGEQIHVGVLQNSKNELTKLLVDNIQQSRYFHATELTDFEQALQQVQSGRFNALIIIDKDSPVTVTIEMDPGSSPQLVNSIHLALEYILEKVKSSALSAQLKQITQQPIVDNNFNLVKSSDDGKRITPTVVQQNTPAWALFGMFFITIPLAAHIVQEKKDCIEQRISIAPTPFIFLLAGRAITYILFNLCQLASMLMVGVFLLPQLGLDGLIIDQQWLVIVIVSICTSLAAISAGLFFGQFMHTQHQITSVGPFLIVIAAAVSGIFIPTYLMPAFMQKIAQFSPLYWAQSSFLDIFVRDAQVIDVLPYCLRLLLFFALMTTLTLVHKANKNHKTRLFIVR